jgi:toxin-antitoxin system PIN domain toxin
MKLPDVNVWLAAAWARHEHHSAAQRWLDAEEDEVALVRVTQMSMLRLVSNPAVMGDESLSRRAAWDVVDALLADPRIQLVQEPGGLEPLWVTFSKRDDASHLLWTDDYLAAFAQAAGAELVTLDRACARRYPALRVRCLLETLDDADAANGEQPPGSGAHLPE